MSNMTNNRHLMSRRALMRGTAATVTLAATRVKAQTTSWPDHPVRFIVPYPAGGSADVMARLYADSLKERLGQPFVIENRPGAGGNIGIDAVAKSAPDGYTVGNATIGHFSINQFLYARMPFDPERDIVPVSLTYDLPNVAVVASQHVQAKTLAEFIAWAKARPDGVTYGSPGVGTSPHLSAALFATRTGIKAVHVPFRGAAQTIPAMLAGDVTFAVDNLASYISVIEGGQMRPLAVTSAERWPTLPNVPTMAEAGVADFVVTSWAAYVQPIATPRAVVEALSAAQREFAADKALQARFLAGGGRILASTPEAATAFAAKERKMWQEVVRLSGLKPE
jgi:tripartite-type tricarboxylate transporter receptor subunit TctC